MLRKTIHATLIVILMMGAASAQSDQFFRGDGENSLRDRNLEKKSDRAIDRAYHSKQIDNDYKAATSKIPDQKANDPWAAIRPTPTAPAKKQQ